MHCGPTDRNLCGRVHIPSWAQRARARRVSEPRSTSAAVRRRGEGGRKFTKAFGESAAVNGKACACVRVRADDHEQSMPKGSGYRDVSPAYVPVSTGMPRAPHGMANLAETPRSDRERWADLKGWPRTLHLGARRASQSLIVPRVLPPSSRKLLLRFQDEMVPTFPPSAITRSFHAQRFSLRRTSSYDLRVINLVVVIQYVECSRLSVWKAPFPVQTQPNPCQHRCGGVVYHSRLS